MSGLFKRFRKIWRGLFRLNGFLRQQVLTVYLLLVSLTTLLGFVFTPVERVAHANLLVCVLSAVLLWGVRVRALFGVTVHTLTALTVLLTVYTAAQTGGIHSTAVVWLHVLSVPVLLLLGHAATLAWMGMVLALTVGLAWVTAMGWVSGQAPDASSLVTWAWLHHLLALLNLMMGVRIYEHLHQAQLRKIQRRNDELQRTHSALIKAQGHADEFVAAVGHELRTPMNAILGFNGSLRSALRADPEQVVVVDHIRTSTEHLLQVVNDLLDFSQWQAGKLRPNPVDFALRALLDGVQERHGQAARNKGLALHLHCDAALPGRVHGDRKRLLQILNQLVGNAIQFTDTGGVQVRLMAQGGALRLEVRDTGPGIAADRQPQLFSRFEHAQAQTLRAHGATGLGLALCDKLVTLLGGRIGVQSQLGQGALFWLQVPLQAASAPDLAPPVPDDGLAGDALRMLVVDDNTLNLMVAQLQLQACWPEAHIVTVDSAAKALAILNTQVFDIALVDMVMPDMDGLQLTQHIRQHHHASLARMPILALTANTQPQDRERCLAAGMDEVLGKPMDTATLVQTVGRFVRQAREATT